MRNIEKFIRGMISRAPLQELITAVPLPPEIHADIRRKQIEARRQIEEVRNQRFYQSNDSW